MERGVESTGDSYSVRCVERVVDILEYLQQHPEGKTLGDIAEGVGVPKSTVFRYLGTLQSRGFVERDGRIDVYRLGFGFALQMPFQVMAARLGPALEQIRRQFDETASLGVLDRGRVLYVSIVESTRPMRLAAREGDHDPLHSTALGKV
ncbi:MAG: IclR family transcriptional regulator, partial [Aeromicrobium sp.]